MVFPWRQHGRTWPSRYASLVSGVVAYRRRLLLHVGLSAWHRFAGGRRLVSDSDAPSSSGNAVRRAADLLAGGAAILRGSGFNRDARKSAARMAGQTLRPGPP